MKKKIIVDFDARVFFRQSLSEDFVETKKKEDENYILVVPIYSTNAISIDKNWVFLARFLPMCDSINNIFDILEREKKKIGNEKCNLG